MYEGFAHVCMSLECAMCVPGAQGDQKRLLDHLEPEIWMTVTHHVGALN